LKNDKKGTRKKDKKDTLERIKKDTGKFSKGYLEKG